MISRRGVIKGMASLIASGFATAAYGVGIEARRHRVTRYRLTPPGWPRDLGLKLAVIADLHACDPWMGVARIEEIVAETNSLGADAVLLLGDYMAGRGLQRWSRRVEAMDWARLLGALKAPLGVYAVLGNHDWWDDYPVQMRRAGPCRARLALEKAGIPVLENDVVRLVQRGRPVWLAGLGDQWAFWPRDRNWRAQGRKIPYEGVDDLDATLAKAGDGAPLVLMAHEPDIFPRVPERVSLTISGHTHGGQVRLLGWAPVVPSLYGARYVYGHIVETGRHLVVSGGLGCSNAPLRLGSPPEIVLIELGSGGLPTA